MRAYLLGQLPDDQAAAFEEEYFVNRAFFLKVQSEETALIADYLDGSLLPAEKQCFESRYLEIPELQRKVEQARRQRIPVQMVAQPSIWTGWRLAFVAASILLVGLGIWVYRSHLTAQPESVAGVQTGLQSAVTIYISPGSTKGPDSKPAQFEPPTSGSTISLVLELPGQSLPVRCHVRISIVKPDGRWNPVWNSPEPVVSTPAGDRQVLTLPLSSSLFQPGDYVVQVWASDDGVHETYVYQVMQPHMRALGRREKTLLLSSGAALAWRRRIWRSWPATLVGPHQRAS